MKTYKLRSDNTVFVYNDADNIMEVYRLAPGAPTSTEAVNVKRETQPADWTGPKSTAESYRVDRIVLDMLHGVQPKTTHGRTGAKVGAVVGIASALLGGPLGPILGGIAGLAGGAWLGARIKTADKHAQLAPIVQVEEPPPAPAASPAN